MTLVTKISKLAKIPQLLKKKQEAEEEAKKKKEDSADRPPFPLKDKPAFKKSRSSAPEDNSTKASSEPKSTNEGIGERIDLTV